MHCNALRALVCSTQLATVMKDLIGEPAGVHLNLSGWQSTRRNWHFDQYLNEPYVGAFYVAVWIGLDDIYPDSGPFEYFPGSHKWWPPISQQKMREALGEDGKGPSWPTHSERILTPLFEQEIADRALTPTTFLASRGDVLFWHGRLLHRGSLPTDMTMERRGLIAHFSGINHRPDMPPAVQHANGGWYFPLGGNQPV
jgi:ectoine hydroxylase-related dioxygenase (phytanoyl-CoA dioxygenase family)